MTNDPALRGRVPELDGIRGVAILLVLVWHYVAVQVHAVPGSMAAYGLKLLSLTWAGVDLFFVLSGFLIGGILLENRKAPNYFKAFYIRRVCRIFPLYYLMFVSFGIAVTWQVGTREPNFSWLHWLFVDPLSLWSYATYSQNFSMADSGSWGPNWMGVTWSLAVEEQFYIVLPLVVRFVPLALLPRLLCILVVVAPIFRTALFFLHPHGGLAGYVLLPARWDALFVGVLGAWAMQQRTTVQVLRRSILVIRSVVVAASLVVLSLLATSQSIGSLGMSAGGHTVIAVLSLGLILLVLISEGGRTQTLFRQPWLVWLGTVSYGIYLFHQPLSGFFHGTLRGQAPQIAGASDATVTLLALCSTLLLAGLSWRFFERPIVVAGQRVSYQWKLRPSCIESTPRQAIS